MARGLVVIKRANSVLAFEPRTENTFPAPSSLSCLVTSGVRMFPGTLYIRSLALRARLCAHTHTHTHTHTHKGKTEGTQRCVRPRNSHPCSLTPTQLIPKQLMPTQLTPTQSYTHAAHTYTTLHPRGTYLFARLNKRALTHTYTCIARNERAVSVG